MPKDISVRVGEFTALVFVRLTSASSLPRLRFWLLHVYLPFVRVMRLHTSIYAEAETL